MSLHDRVTGSGLTLSFVDSMNLLVITKNDTQNMALPFDGVNADTQLTIPSGIAVRFLIHAYKNSLLILQGDTVFTAKAGEKIDLILSLDFIYPAVILTPAKQEVQAGDILQFDIAVRAIDEKFYKAVTRIEFNPDILRFKSAIKNEDFLKQEAGYVTVQLTDTDGMLIHDVEITPRASGVSGDGSLTRIRMEALRSGLVTVLVSSDPAVAPNLGIYDLNDQLISAVNLGCRIAVN